ncbi:hypothetical protein DFP72DRAFT_1069030 [Ephemerocybe angulata]|uniref:Uncharacterized protein n=1 Tax=Ephemerocybe angulata TaxID=980116 RepID=A0A8H6M776_9AGAR|nr:hypothetical protein DFP72DRAFT_1069030 [Tulosesus angulatus]
MEGRRRRKHGHAYTTVVGIAPYARKDHYTPVPIVVSSSDKTEKGEELVKWIAEVLERWKAHPHGEKVHGPIWSLASDGDSAYRAAKHIYCILEGEEISPSTRAGQVLHLLEGLNLFMSKDGITGTCDPKHIFKRFATLLRNTEGITVNETQITPSDIIENLSMLPNLSQETATGLLDPADKQNVPKAVSLIQHLNMLRSIQPALPRRAGKRHRYEVLTFLGEFFNYFMLPFIDVDMSLTDQIKSLATFSHIAAALYIRHRTACLTGPLYADCQMVIKNIIFTVARLQEIDPDAEFHIILEGTDRLEGLFGDVRTQDHARNFDIKQAAEKLSTATLLNAAFQRNRDLDRGHRRLSLTGCIGIDHINPESWIGSVRVGDVDLKECWEFGRDSATAVLRKYFPGMDIPDFKSHFQQPGIDILRPSSSGYVGVSSHPSDARSEVESGAAIALGPQPPIPANIPDSDFMTEDPATYELYDIESDPEDDEDECLDDENDDFLYGEDIPIGIELEDVLSDNINDHMSNNPCSDSPTFSKYIDINGKKYLKASLVGTLSTKFSKKVTLRVLRARGVATETALTGSSDRRRFDSSNLDSSGHIKSGDLAAILVKTALPGSSSPRDIALAVMEVTGFREGNKRHDSLPSAKLRDPLTKVVGQLLALEHSQGLGEDDIWEWHKRYLKLDTTAKDPVGTRRQFVVEVPGLIIFPLDADVVERAHTPLVDGQALLPITWALSSSLLSDTCSEAWAGLSPDTAELVGNLAVLPVVKNPALFPYKNANGVHCFTVAQIPAGITDALANTTKLTARSRVPCYLCPEANISLGKMREHIGRHILHAARTDDEGGDGDVGIGLLPCGFCGRDGEGCMTQLQIGRRKAMKIVSTCPYKQETMKYNTEKESTDASPCSNIPIHCPLCPKSASGESKTIWKYNAVYHILDTHPESRIPATFLKAFFTSAAEEGRMGIEPEMTREFRDRFGIQDSDGVEAMEAQDSTEPLIPMASGSSRGRERSGTVTQTQFNWWPNS